MNFIELRELIRLATEEDKVFSFFLGSGASAKPGIPPELRIRTGKELAEFWLGEIKARKDEVIPRAIFKLFENAPAEHYTEIYQYRFGSKIEGFTTDNGYEFIAQETEKGNLTESFGYFYLATLIEKSDHRIVITTNFDKMVETAIYKFTNRNLQTVYHPEHAKTIKLDKDSLENRAVLAKIHSDMYNHPVSAASQLAELHHEWKDRLEKIFEKFPPIFIGCSGNDKDVMDFLSELGKTRGKAQEIYWLCRSGKRVSDDVKKVLDKLDTRYVEIPNGFDRFMMDFTNAVVGTDKIKIDDTVANAQGLVEKLKKSIDKSYAEVPPVTPDDYLYRGNYHFSVGNGGGATVNFADNSATGEAKENSRSLTVNNGNAVYGLQLYGLQLANAEEYRNRGVLYGQVGEYDEAIANYTKAIELNPDYAMAYNSRGFAYRNLGEYDKAIADYTKAIELKPDYARAYFNRGYAFDDKGEYDKAIADYTKAIEFKPDYAVAYYNRGCVFDDEGEYDKAIADYTKAIELEPDDAVAYNNRGVTYRAMDKHAEADADFAKVKELGYDDNNDT
ncbi:hypothetical protein FACS1894133_6470 [Clostridia bacterium]|nr:hypothetical protein FACS1894133_6470 [Clostridia bacterium]